ncbi:CHY zinc finger protein [Halobacillus mangrovi]|uniref:CHY-type domain-containing protein n=1 Tax=Halobacillus mangrovi TaxID=402384 RepID=A0A1W5ZZ05_9BACI|nr:CHY zinc finger protein [Halobacillus mangrovi]ARI78500.1 hypothetical protein HM131_17380 [Halobacillus mangrovi]
MGDKRPNVKGIDVDTNTRCAHYHTEKDIIAIKFHCCKEYYACYYCHKEAAGHHAIRWPKEEWDGPAILCGNCSHELSISTYLDVNNCPNCDHEFNEGCSNHYHLYFEYDRKGL